MTDNRRFAAERMTAWYRDQQVPKELKTARHETIHNTKLLIETALATMEHSEANSTNFRAAYMRLYHLKQHLTT